MSIFFSNPKAGFQSKKKLILSEISKFIDSGEYILGSQVNSFEMEFNNFLNNKGYFVSCANGTDAITLSLLTHGITKGSVIAPSHTATASIIGIRKAGCSPVYADVDPETLLISLPAIESILKGNKNIKAILAVHLYGNGIHIRSLNKLAKKYNCIVIEDCAQSCGTFIHDQQSGTMASAGCFSFFPTKNLPALGDGGGLWLPTKKLQTKAKSIRQYGWNEKRIVTIPNGMNSRLDEIQAAILRIRLKTFKKEILQRRKIASLYNSDLSKKFCRVKEGPHQKSSYHLYVVRVRDRSKLITYMQKHDIFLGIHYFPCNHINGLLSKKSSKLPVTEKIIDEVISLPIFPELRVKDQIQIIKLLNEF
jgi:dTDP-4-amino-4,6-dideoxygalactose transaminase